VSRVTIADVASAAGVSKTAVSFAFNSPDKLGPATVERVLRIARDLGYAPHPAARALSTRRSGTIGILVPQALSAVFGNPFLGELIQGLGELCSEHDLSVLLVPPLDGSLESAIRSASVDGFISLGVMPGDGALELLDRLAIPNVLVDSDGFGHHAAVNVDDRAGAELAARHLLALGHRRFAIVGLPHARGEQGQTPTSVRRLAGYRHAIEAAGAPEPAVVWAGVSVEEGADVLRALPTGRERPTAILAMSDTVAVGILSAARGAGMSVPQDLSVVGYDDIPIAAWTRPPLTTVRQPIIEKGRLAAKLLIDQMKGRPVESPAPLPTTLVVRESTSGIKEVVGRPR
jgi:DNA-binding LacI/PurR family transcriptional regulator